MNNRTQVVSSPKRYNAILVRQQRTAAGENHCIQVCRFQRYSCKKSSVLLNQSAWLGYRGIWRINPYLCTIWTHIFSRTKRAEQCNVGRHRYGRQTSQIDRLTVSCPWSDSGSDTHVSRKMLYIVTFVSVPPTPQLASSSKPELLYCRKLL